MIKKLTPLLIPLFMLLISCNSDKNHGAKGIITYNFSKIENIDDIKSNFSFVDITPLSLNKEMAISDMCEISLCKDGYIFTDKMNKKIYRFGDDGAYINMIGAMGKAKIEYLDISNIQIIDNLIYVYSYQNSSILIYDLNGEFKESIKTKVKAQQYLIDNSNSMMFAYLGYDNGVMEARAIMSDLDDNLQQEYLKSNIKILAFSEMNPPLTKYNDRIYIRESYNNKINVITNDYKSTEVAYDFDFGKYNIPPTTFTQEDAFSAAKILMSSDFASINKLMNSKNSTIVQVTFQITSKNSSYNVIGISKDNTNWRWITTSQNGENSLLFSSIKTVTEDDELLLLLSTDKLSELKKNFKDINIETAKECNSDLVMVRLKIND